MNKEIEIKFKLASEHLNRLRQWLGSNASYQGHVEQTEYYLNNPKQSFLTQREDGFRDIPESYLRVRCTKQGDWVTFKKWHLDPTTGSRVYADEYEAALDSGSTMVGLLEQLGYTEKVVIKKSRSRWNYRAFEIVVDEVEGIGTFIEIELKQCDDSVDQGREQIYSLMRNLGISKIERIDRGYLCMRLNPTHSFGTSFEL